MGIQIQKNYNLRDLTTMKVGGVAKFFVEVSNVTEVKAALEFAQDKKLAILVLGGGSNIIISDQGFDGLVLYIKILGFEIIKEDKEEVLVKIGAGEIWDKIVVKAVKRDWWGIENLSDIPGTAGALVVQNAGAYGIEAEDVVKEIEVLNVKNKTVEILNNQECGFKYRQSIFKNEKRGEYIILDIILRLKKKGKVNVDYRDVKEYFLQHNINQPDLRQVREAIVAIRQSKLPDLDIDGNCGSMFLNSVLSKEEYEKLKEKIQENFTEVEVNKLEYFKENFWSKQGIKIPTAWLLDICNLKGVQIGGAQVYIKWPLAIINKNFSAKAKDILELIKKIRQIVYSKTGLILDPEINLVGFNQRELEKYFKLVN